MKRRFLAWLLCTVMLFNNALPVFATEGEGDQIIIENTDTTTETTSESTAATEATTTASSAATEPTSETTEPETEAKKEEITSSESENTSASEETSSETSSTAASSENTSETTTEAADGEECTCGAVADENGNITHELGCTQNPIIPCGKCNEYFAEDGSCACCSECGAAPSESHSDDCSNKPCEHCEQVGDHAEGCPALCICGDEHNASDYNCPLFEGPRYCECDYDIETLEHEDGCHVPVAALHKKLMKAETAEEMFTIFMQAAEEKIDVLFALTFDEIESLKARVNELDPDGEDEYAVELLLNFEVLPNNTCPDCGGTGMHEENCPWVLGKVFAPQNNVHNKTLDKWYSTLSGAVAAASNGNIIEVYNSFTETTSVEIRKQNITIKAADGYNPIISWTNTKNIPINNGATPYHCVVIYTDVTTSTTFGDKNGTGVLTFDASKASDEDNKGKRARVMMHCGSGTLYLKDGIVLTGGNTGGGNYYSNKDGGRWPVGSGEVTGEVNFGSGLYMYDGTLEMSGGEISNNYSLFSRTNNAANGLGNGQNLHNYYGGGGGVYLYGTTDGTHKTTMIMSGGKITHNAAGSGGGGGILVGFGSELTVTNGVISENVSRFASGGGIGVRINSEVKIQGGLIKENYVEGHGGGLFARGDSVPLEITGGTFENNEAGGYGGAVNFWTVSKKGDTEENALARNKLIIGGDVKIINNSAHNGGGISVGREVENGAPQGFKAMLVIQGNPIISGNVASNVGGGIDMQYDSFDKAVNTVEIHGGTFSNNEAKNGAGIYVPGGTVTMTGGTFSGNKASNRGAGIFTGGGTFTITNGTFSKNIADDNGGGIYMLNGNIEMSNGSFIENSAENGGAAYVDGGNFTIHHGVFNKNSATGLTEDKTNRAQTNGSGGAIFISGDDSTKLIMESGEMNENTANNDGGAIYATAGEILIGLKGCTGGTDLSEHTKLGAGRHHPIIKGNTAADCGGAISISNKGIVHFYCGEATNNKALYKGVGLNVFIDGGEFHFYPGTNVGEPHDPDLVIIGGTLENHDTGAVPKWITLKYFNKNDSGTSEAYTGMARENEFMNLPEGEYFYGQRASFAFVGWTPFSPDTTAGKEYVRKIDDYKPSGTSIKINDTEEMEEVQNTFDGKNDDTMHLYAVWAPIENDINYVDSLTNGVSATSKYEIDKANSQTITISASNATQHPGFDVVGWYLYQNEGQNANWCEFVENKYEAYEPEYANGAMNYAKTGSPVKTDGYMKYYKLDTPNADLTLTVPSMTFGDITLVADYALAHGDLTIEKDGWEGIDPYQTFIFDVNSTEFTAEKFISDKKITVNSTLDVYDELDNLEAVDLEVMVAENGSVTITHLPLGTYTVTEDENWSWRYSVDTEKPNHNPVTVGAGVNSVTVYNKRDNIYWMDGNAWCRNIFGDDKKVTQKPVPKEYKS